MNLKRPLQIERASSTDHRNAKDAHFESVYHRYYRQVYGICRRYNSRTDDAKDMTQEVFIRYFQNFKKFRHEASPSTWMHRVAINLGIQKWRQERNRLRHDQELQFAPAEIPDQETLMLNRITLNNILGSYSERTRKIVFMHHVERMTQMEIGKKLGVSRATVTRHLVQIRRAY